MTLGRGWVVLVTASLVAGAGCSLDKRGESGPSDAAIDGAALDGGDAAVDAGDGGPELDGGGLDAGDDASVDAGRDAGCSGPPFCSGDTLFTCSGGALTSTPCPLGCSSGSCRAVVPSNVGSGVSFSDGAAELEVANGELWIAYPDTGRIEARDAEDPETILRVVRAEGLGTASGIRYVQLASGSASVTYGVFVVRSLRVRPDAIFVGNATSARSLVLVSAGEVRIEGVMSVGGSVFGPGPGAGDGGAAGADGEGLGAGDRGVSGPGNDDSGGGGGSFGGAGGPGGDSPSRNGGNEGSTYGSPELVPLHGGSGGGGGGGGEGGRGGHGGGALQITSATRIVVTATGVVDAGGEGGRGGITGFAVLDSGAGGGGGSGGAILLEAIEVTLAANRVAAPGGGGGQGARCDICDESNSGTNGGDGTAVRVPATGSATSAFGGGGGTGSSAAGVAGAGADAANGGGGGGGAGRIRINDATGTGSFALIPTIASGLSSVGMVGRTP